MEDDPRAPCFPIAGIRSVELSVPDLAAAERFYTDVWGLTVADRADGTLYLRGTGTDPYLVALREGPVAIDSVTWTAAEGTDLAAVHARLISAGGSDATEVGPVALSGGGQGFALRDPSGRTLRVVQGATPAPRDSTSSIDALFV